ncbi:MAG: DUF3137 domain-containing protein, partial [Odoribacter sp.]|nr:DUF3137 domain-containing protein [Odoribacter sp.]
ISFDALKARLTPALNEIEEERVKLKNKAVSWGSLSAITIALLVFAIGTVTEEWGACLIVGIIIWVIIISIITSGKKKLSAYYKQHIIAPFVEALLENGKYEPNNGISSKTFNECGLFQKPDRYNCEDLMYGQKGQTTVSFSEVHAQEKRTTTDSKGRTQTYWVTIFKGFMFVADFHKHFNGRTVVSRKRFSLWNKNRVKLEDPEFEKRFNVYSPDQVEARYILSTSMMQRITELDRKFNGNVQLSFVNSNVVIAISSSRNYFEFNIWKSVNEPGLLREEYNIIDTLVSIVEALNLNTRIWTKE